MRDSNTMLDKESFKAYSDGINREAAHAYSMFWGDGTVADGIVPIKLTKVQSLLSEQIIAPKTSTEFWNGLLKEIREDKPDYETDCKKKHKKIKETEKPVKPVFTDDRLINLED